MPSKHFGGGAPPPKQHQKSIFGLPVPNIRLLTARCFIPSFSLSAKVFSFSQ
jgi:hypothetical protein